MAMVLKCDVSTACRHAGTEKPVDLVHLSRVTMGDRKLELEILRMFAAQIPQFLMMIDQSSCNDTILRTAHTIKGAARSIGAFRLAAMAEDSEDTRKLDRDGFASELKVICSYIEDLSKTH